MANIKISDLTAAAAASGTQEFEVNDSLTSKKVTGAQLLSYVQANTTPASIGAVSTSDTIAVAKGGTGATTASGARTNLGLVIGTDVLAPNGSGASLTSLNGSNISSGTVAPARLGSGTPSASNYLRGDGSWATVSGGVTSITAGTGLTGGTITSSGTIALDYYTGTAANNTSYPVGSYLSADYTGASSSIINSAQTLWVATSDNAFTAYNPGGRTVMAGTWRSRGKTSGDPWFLVQRTA